MFLPSVIARSVATRQSLFVIASTVFGVWQSHFCILSSFVVVWFFPTIIIHTITIRYSYTPIYIFLLTTNLYFSRSLYVIPAQAGIHPFLSLRAQIYRGVAISSYYIIQYSLFFHYKNYKKTIIFINITIFIL